MVHSHSFTDGAAWRGKKALVLGTGNSGHDVAQDLHSHGADTTIIQRGSTTVVSIDPSAKLNYALYDEERRSKTAICSRARTPIRSWCAATSSPSSAWSEFDKEMIDGLIARGFKYDIGEDKTGHQMKYRRRGGGYYLDVGCSGLIIDGEIGLLQFDQIERFVAEGALLKDGSIRPADLLVLATGYVHAAGAGAPPARRRHRGEASARSGASAPDGEMANMWKRTPQEGLWFIAGSLAQCRIYSKYLALQIKAIGSRTDRRRRRRRAERGFEHRGRGRPRVQASKREGRMHRIGRRAALLGGVAAPFISAVGGGGPAPRGGSSRTCRAAGPHRGRLRRRRRQRHHGAADRGQAERTPARRVLRRRQPARRRHLVAAEHVARAAPDGTTLMYASLSTLIAPLVNRGSALDPPRDFAAVAMAQSSPLLLVSRPDFPARTLAEVIALAKERSGRLTVSHPGSGGINHLSMAMLTRQTGAEFTLVPYNGNHPSLTALVRGDVDLASDSPFAARSLLEQGAIRAVAVTSAQRSAGHARRPDLRRDGARLRGDVLGRPPRAARHAGADPRPAEPRGRRRAAPARGGGAGAGLRRRAGGRQPRRLRAADRRRLGALGRGGARDRRARRLTRGWPSPGNGMAGSRVGAFARFFPSRPQRDHPDHMLQNAPAQRGEEQDRPGWARFWPLAALLAAFVLAWAFGLFRYASLDTLAEYREALARLVADRPVSAALLYLAAYTAAVAVSIPAGPVLTMAGGLLFGRWLGAALALPAATAGACVLFLAVRSALAPAVAQRAGPLMERLRPGLERDGFWYLLSCASCRSCLTRSAASRRPWSGCLFRPSPPRPRWASCRAPSCSPASGAGLGEVFARGGRPDASVMLSPPVLLPLLGLAALSLAAMWLRKRRRGDA